MPRRRHQHAGIPGFFAGIRASRVRAKPALRLEHLARPAVACDGGVVGHELYGQGGVRGVDRRGQRRADVVALEVDLPGPDELVGAVIVLGCPCRQVRIEAGMPDQQRRRSHPSRRAVPRRTGGWSPAGGSECLTPLSSATTSERATKPVTRSMTSSGSTGSPLQISSMASRVQPPENTAMRASSRCSAAFSSS